MLHADEVPTRANVATTSHGEEVLTRANVATMLHGDEVLTRANIAMTSHGDEALTRANGTTFHADKMLIRANKHCNDITWGQSANKGEHRRTLPSYRGTKRSPCNTVIFAVFWGKASNITMLQGDAPPVIR